MSPPRNKPADDSSAEEKACRPYACAIQKCLSANNYDEKRCKAAIAQWKQCLKEHAQR